MAIALETSPKKLTLAVLGTLPETKPASDYINGQIYQKPMPQGQYSALQSEIVTAINLIGKPQKVAYAFPELRCNFDNISIVPDIAVMRWETIPFLPNKRIANKILVPPDWIIEVLSPDQSPIKVMNKIGAAISNGTQLGWLISPEQELIMVYDGDRLPETKRESDSLKVLDVLSDWQIAVNDVFNLLNLE